MAGCGSSTHSTASTAPTASTAAAGTPSSASTTAASGCHSVPTPKPHAPQNLKAPTLKLDPAKTYTVTVTTNCGTFSFVLDVRQQPKTSASVYSLVKRGFYDGLLFQRVAASFVIQGGSPIDQDAGGPGYTVVEAPPSSTQYLRGDVAMAKTAAQPSGASGSQFFVVTGANVSQSDGLTPVYALAGKVTSGQDVVDAIGALPTNPPQDGTPSPAVVMERVTVKVS